MAAALRAALAGDPRIRVLSRFYKAQAAPGLTILSGAGSPAGKETGHG